MPAVWLCICTLTAGWQKLFHESPSIGFLSLARKYSAAMAEGKVLAPAKSVGDMSRIVVNNYIDAGLCALFMGLERIAAVLQGTHDNYETDLFRSLIAAIVEETNVPAEGKHKASNRVIADHLRASSFLIADGVLPSNEGRGYVLRRIMRQWQMLARPKGPSMR